ncbi:MAG: phosphoribosylformylglycinamidine cyclo-ligase [Candidatus Levybacteria bacterium]|nr:phosphoribosylformylglycinamidine cyclo-ligase [Candidatus Levybacteria bacterium]
MKKITYYQVGDNYDTKDPVKKLFQEAALATGKNLKSHKFEEVEDSRGESAYVWSLGSARDKKQGPFLASVIEGLGTKNLVADGMRKIVDPERSRRTYYDVVAHDTVATIINDLVSVGATPLVLHAYWAIEDNDWLYDKERMTDLITGWKKACDIAGVSWGGGETPTLKQIIEKGTAEFGGSAVGIIRNKKHLITDKKLRAGDRIVLIKSNGVNANGISLARAVAKKLPKGYAAKLHNGKLYGESLLTPSNIYAKVVQDLQKAGVDIHYISNITGHGIRKIMRARPSFTYVLEKIFKPQPVFEFIAEHAGLDDTEMYGTYNMGQDYALFISQKDVNKCLKIIKKNKLVGLDAGYVEKGSKQVIMNPKNLVYSGETLDLR